MFMCIMLYCFIILEKQIIGSQESGVSIVSPSDVQQGGSFTVTCDAERAGLPDSVKTILKLNVYWTDDYYRDFRSIAEYKTFDPPYTYRNSNGNWKFDFSGSLNDTSDTPNNRNSMKIKIVVYNARCDDSGIYYCEALYYDADDNRFYTSHFQHAYVRNNKVDVLSLSIEPHQFYEEGLNQYESLNPAGSEVLLTCEASGPDGLTITWRYGNSSEDRNSFKPYPEKKDIDFSGSLPDGFDWTNCDRYWYKSTLTFQTEEKFDGYTYVCEASLPNWGTNATSMTIYTKQSLVDVAKLVSRSVIEVGESFTVTCDASRAGVPVLATTVTNLTIGRENGTSQTTYAIYQLLETHIITSPPETSPARNWSFTFSGAQEKTSDSPNNKNSMKIEMMVHDARCTDAGLYYCKATYLDSNNITYTAYRKQDIGFITKNYTDSLTLEPYDEDRFYPAGSDVTLTCSVSGLKDIILNWKYGKSDEDVSSFLTYPVQDVTTVTKVSETKCLVYYHWSTLTFQTEDKYDGYMYVCVATTNDSYTVVGNMTIYTIAEVDRTGNTDIVSPSVIKEGGVFTVTCDASRAGVPTNINTVSDLSISWAAQLSNKRTIYALYRSIFYPYKNSYKPETNPERKWAFRFYGGLQETSKQPNNRNTMRVQIKVKDANSSDFGFYFCRAAYLALTAEIEIKQEHQYIGNETTTVPLISTTSDYVFLYYAIPVVAVVVLGVVVLTVCLLKVRRDRARKRRFNLRTLPAVHRESLSPPMDSNGYLSPVDPNGGYAQISDVAIYESSANYYSSINELEFIKESDEQSENISGMQDKQEGDLDNLSELDTKRDGQLDIKTDTVVDIKTRKRLDIQTDLKPDTKTDKDLDKDRQNDPTSADDLNDYTKLYDTPADVYSPDVNKYSTPNFASFI